VFFNFNPTVLGGRSRQCSACESERQRGYGTREVTVPDEKQCSICQQTLPAAQFSRRRHSCDGLKSSCKQCISALIQAPAIAVPVVSKKCGSCGLALPAAAFSRNSR